MGRRIWLGAHDDGLLQILDAFPDEAVLVGGSSEIQIEVKVSFVFSLPSFSPGSPDYLVFLLKTNLRYLSAVQFNAQAYPLSVYICNIPELSSVSLPTPFSFGANLSPRRARGPLHVPLLVPPQGPHGPLKAIQAQLLHFAGRRICNVAFVGGNIAKASPISDLNPMWVALGARVVVRVCRMAGVVGVWSWG